MNKCLSAFNNFPDTLNGLCQVFQITLVSPDGLLPIPLVHVSTMIVIKEIILAYCTHVCDETLTRLHAKLLQRYSFPFGGSLDNLGVDWMLVVIVRDVKLNGSARAVAVQVIV